MSDNEDKISLDDLFENISSDDELSILQRESCRENNGLDTILSKYYSIKMDGYQKATSDMEKYPFLKLFYGFLYDKHAHKLAYFLSNIVIDDDFIKLIEMICREKTRNYDEIMIILKRQHK